MLTVIAEIKIREGDDFFQTVVQAFQQVTPLVLQESGCYGYTLYVDQPTGLSFQRNGAHSIIMFEQWETAEALQAHLQTVHMLECLAQIQDAVLETSIRIMEPKSAY